mmetsp:Transcript_2700/g.8646  ORF Transcript_2700/g.8646 Transcript_2700/m.8646 type:complete len:219 (-) Transcript_2700:1392-2048(-)
MRTRPREAKKSTTSPRSPAASSEVSRTSSPTPSGCPAACPTPSSAAGSAAWTWSTLQTGMRAWRAAWAGRRVTTKLTGSSCSRWGSSRPWPSRGSSSTTRASRSWTSAPPPCPARWSSGSSSWQGSWASHASPLLTGRRCRPSTHACCASRATSTRTAAAGSSRTYPTVMSCLLWRRSPRRVTRPCSVPRITSSSRMRTSLLSRRQRRRPQRLPAQAS